MLLNETDFYIVMNYGHVFQGDSIFNMRRPYDLMAFHDQEERSFKLETLKKELLSRKEEIDKNEDKDTGELKHWNINFT